MTDEPQTFSIALRLQRITYEDAYVAIPVTSAIMKHSADGKSTIDFDAFVAEGLRIAADSRVEWKVESTDTIPHPVQAPKPDDRTSFDAFYADAANE